MLDVELDASKLRGDPQLLLEDTDTFESVQLAIQFTPNGASGGVTAQVHGEDSEDPGERATRFEPLATWPTTNPCLDHLPVLFGQRLGPVDPSAAIEQLQKGATVYWEDGTSSEMTLALNSPRRAACFEIPPFGYEDPSNLWAILAATVDVKTVDGRWDASYEGVQVEMSLTYSGDRATTYVTHFARATQKQLEQLGFAGLDLDGEEAQLTLRMFVEGETLEGVVEVTIADSSGKACEAFEPCETRLVLGKIGDPTLEVTAGAHWR